MAQNNRPRRGWKKTPVVYEGISPFDPTPDPRSRPTPMYKTVLTRPGPSMEIKGVDKVSPSNPGTTQAPWPLGSDSNTIVCLNAITPGTGSWQRIGRKITMRSLHLVGNFSATANDAEVTDRVQYIRIAVLYDKQPNGDVPALGDIFQSQLNSAASSTLTNVWSPLNLNNRDRFEILRDYRCTLPGTNMTSDSPGVIAATAAPLNFNMYIPLGNRETYFKSDTSPSTVADISTGSLILVAFSQITAATCSWNAQITTRLRYTDQ